MASQGILKPNSVRPAVYPSLQRALFKPIWGQVRLIRGPSEWHGPYQGDVMFPWDERGPL